jgi:hypothetical protein
MAMMMMVASALAAVSWGKSMAKETQESACAVAMTMATLADFLVSSLNLISIAGGRRIPINLSIKKSSICGNQYLDYL